MIRRTVLAAAAWAALCSPGYAEGKKPVVGIVGVDVASQNIDCRQGCQRFAEGFRAMLETAVVKSGKMAVYERTRLDRVFAEQMLSEHEITQSGGGIGGLTGVDYLVYGAVTKFGESQQGFSTGGIGGLLDGVVGQIGASVSSGKASVEMAVDIRVSDVATGEIVVAESVDGTVTTGEAFSIGGISSSSGSADPYADVQRVVAARIAEAVVTNRIPIKVIAVQEDDSFVLNYGNAFLREGDMLSVFDVGATIVDPDTGEVLGSEETRRGSIRVVESYPKFAKARFSGDSFAIALGDVVRRPPLETRRAERQRSGPRWRDDPARGGR